MRSRPNLVAPRLTPYIPVELTIKQSAFLVLPQLEAFYGGATGGGKSVALLAGALQYVDQPGYSALLLRRTYADLALPLALMDLARQWLMGTDAKWSELRKTWTFPSGATLTFGYLETEKDKYRYQGASFQYIGFDELSQFTESQYLYLFSRLRKGANLKVDIPLRMRSASNPGGVGGAWVYNRFINLETRHPDVIFLSAGLNDNPYIDQEEYRRSMSRLSEAERKQLLEGQWVVEVEDALWNYALLESRRKFTIPDDLEIILVAVDPKTSVSASSETGIVVIGARTVSKINGKALMEGFLLADLSLDGTPEQWGQAVVDAYDTWEANYVVVEVNQGGDMVRSVLKAIDADLPIKEVRASQGKRTRAEPIAALYQAGRFHHIGIHTSLETQLCTWVPGAKSPDRLDALVWGATAAVLKKASGVSISQLTWA